MGNQVAKETMAHRIETAKRLRAKVEKEAAELADLRTRLEKEHSTALHPKADLLWAKAWEHGHANGYADVEHWYSEFTELIS